MFDFRKSTLILAVLAAASLTSVSISSAQSVYDDRNTQTLLVSPEGDILDYVPEVGEVMISRDRMGRTVLIDRMGNLVATEIPAESYYPPRQRGGNRGLPGVYDPYAEPAPRGWDDDVTTASIPDIDPRDSLPLEGMPQDMPYGGPDLPAPADTAGAAAASNPSSFSSSDAGRRASIQATAGSLPNKAHLPDGSTAQVAIRAEAVTLQPGAGARVLTVRPHGAHDVVRIEAQNVVWRVLVPARTALGESVSVQLQASGAFAFSA